MAPAALNASEVAREFGRSADWLHQHWRELVADKKLPPPLIEKGGLTWSAAQVYALLDRPLTAGQRAAAAAYRAAFAAAAAAPSSTIEADEIAASVARIAAKLEAAGRGGGA